MTDVNTASTDLTSQYAAQVSGDLEANRKEQDRVTADIAALQEQLSALKRDHAVLMNVQQALGVTAAPTAPAEEPTVAPESGASAADAAAAAAAAESVTVPAPRRKAPAKPGAGQRARRSTAPRGRARTGQSPAKSPAGKALTERPAAPKASREKTSSAKAPTAEPAGVTSSGVKSPGGKSAGAGAAAGVSAPAEAAAPATTAVAKSTAAKGSPAKSTARSTAAKAGSAALAPEPAAGNSASTAATSGKAAPTSKADRTGKAGAKPVQPTLVELVRAHLAGQKEPRSSAEVATALGASHPDRAIKPTVVRTTLEGLVAKNHAQRSKQGSSVFYTAADRTGPDPVPAESSKG